MKPDFNAYSLALIQDGQILHTSQEAGLKPLVTCLKQFADRRGCTLHDRVIGFAAARLIAHFRIIDHIVTGVASDSAELFLSAEGIDLRADRIVSNILTRDRSAVCPGEKIALETPELQTFLEKIHALVEQFRS